MDLLSDILKNSGIQKRILNHRSTSDDWVYDFQCEKSIGFHIVTSGEVYLKHKNQPHSQLLKRGDIIFMSRGTNHQLFTDAKLLKDQNLSVVSGAYTFINEPLHPFFKEMPDSVIISYNSLESYNPIHQYTQLLELEANKKQLGAETIIASLLDVLFHLILRKIIDEKSIEPSNWCHASNDLQMARVLELMHEKPEANWSLEELAHQGGFSRAAFALKFKSTLGETPLQYLTTLRIQKAMGLLSDTNQNLESISDQVGYSDAFSFSKSFKKRMGLSPKKFRIQALAS